MDIPSIDFELYQIISYEIIETCPILDQIIVPNTIALTENLAAQNRLVDAEKIALETLSDAQQKLDERNSLILQAKSHLDKLDEGT